ncbi:LysE/ArgO family amino acid transporter [Saxibacter everestensis]
MTLGTVLTTGLAGFGAGLSLIIAIGSQNAFVLRQGIRREHVLPIVLICSVSDLVLIALGVGGIGVLVETASGVATVIRWLGAGFLICYGLIAARRALRPGTLEPDRGPGRTSLTGAVLTCMTLTWLNPHVYLDTVLMLGSIASSHNSGRWIFGGGAMLASVVWFSALGFGARLLRGFFARPASWRILDGIIAILMLVLGVLMIL